MAAEGEAQGGEASLPALSRADGGGVVQEAVGFFLAGEAGEFFVEGMVGREEGFFAVEDGWVVAAGVVPAIKLGGAEVEFDGADEGRVGVGFEVDQDIYKVPRPLSRMR